MGVGIGAGMDVEDEFRFSIVPMFTPVFTPMSVELTFNTSELTPVLKIA